MNHTFDEPKKFARWSYLTIVQNWTEVHREMGYDSKWGRTQEARVPATASKDIYHGMLSAPPGPLRFRRE
jgi:hypothetical protein